MKRYIGINLKTTIIIVIAIIIGTAIKKVVVRTKTSKNSNSQSLPPTQTPKAGQQARDHMGCSQNYGPFWL